MQTKITPEQNTQDSDTPLFKVSHMVITAEAGAGQRIDNYLFNKLKGVPKSKIYNILRKGEVRVNRGRVKPTYKLQAEDIIRVPPINLNLTIEEAPITETQAASFNLDQAVLYEDKNLLIINKPAGLAVHGGSGLRFGLIEILRTTRPQDKHLELVHRLDRDTSGCIMIAKNALMLRGLHAMLRDGGKIKKDYHALVKGYVAGDFKVSEPLKKFTLQSGERRVSVNAVVGQPSLTEFVLLERYNNLSLLLASPITGRTHQIRVHAAHRGLPIVGDDKYGVKEFNQSMRKLELKRMYLHARQLVFTCPLTNAKIAVEAPYDDVWINGINNLSQGKISDEQRT